MNVHKNIRIYGKVIGVFFRLNTTEEAQQLGLTGFVQNEPDQSVYVEVEGQPNQIDKLLEWLKEGPPEAVVHKIEVSDGPLKNFTNFETRRD